MFKKQRFADKVKQLIFIKNSVIQVVIFLCDCSSQSKMQQKVLTASNPIAFPGAKGFEKFTTVGRGGKVFVVSNLNDKGPGSFREAAENKVTRVIIYAVSGTIHLETKLSIKGNVIIARQTSPGDGIRIAGQPVGLGGNNMVVEYLCFRMGNKYQRGSKVDGNGGNDALNITRRINIIIDHCSLSWSSDEAFAVYDCNSKTLPVFPDT